MIKLFAVDLDDTFLDKNDNMSKENINAVRDLVDAGVKVVLNSGRTEVLDVYKRQIIMLEMI